MTTPQDNPSIYDKIIIGGVLTPGKCILVSGGDRDIEKDAQNQAGYKGKIVITKGDAVSVLTYRFEIWTDDDFAEWVLLEQRLEQARNRKPKEEALEIIDPRLRGRNFLGWTVKTITKLITVEAGKWAHDVTFWENPRTVKIPRAPATKSVQDAFKREAAEASAARDAAAAEATAAVATAKQDAAPVISAFKEGLGI